MINIIDKEKCTGCAACIDCCPKNSISFQTDIEGFNYPVVDLTTCIQCGLCEKTCPLLNVEKIKDKTRPAPVFYASFIKDENIRINSTSGGIFSGLAKRMYEQEGFVGGAVYTDKFTVQQVISNKAEDLLRIRGSKYFQSDTQGFYRQVKKLLQAGEKVLVCAAPCQISGLHFFLGKEYENLITVDFICLGINSPKVFHKYLSSLEKRYGARVNKIQAKNKDLGWRSLAYKIGFENGKTYLKEGRKDPFTRGFIGTHCISRPACYDCKFKGFPRISDISLGDFWGIENVDTSMDDNKGTSVVIINTSKGADYFESIKDVFETKKVELKDAVPGNLALIQSIPRPQINRDDFYKDMDKLPFDKVVQKYYPLNLKKRKLKRIMKMLQWIIRQMRFHPKPYMQFLRLNFFRAHTKSNVRAKKFILPTRHVVLNIHKTARLTLSGLFVFGYKRIHGSKLESRLAVEENASFILEKKSVTAYYGTDITVFKNAKLSFLGSATLNQNVQIICMDSITIGDDVLISRDVVIRDNDGGHEILVDGYKKTAPVIIGNHVWIGQGAVIMKGVQIGDGAIIGAGAWVATNVKPKTVIMGDPARAIQKDVEWIH